MKPGDLVTWKSDPPGYDHTWLVKGVYHGALGQESVVEVENVSHKPAWSGPWETHVMMFIPECLLRNCKIVERQP